MISSAKTLVRRLLPHSLYRRYRRHKIASAIAAYQPREVTHTYGGHRLRVHLADPLAEAWYDHDWERQAQIELLTDRDVLRAGATVFDLGAHQAIVALMLAREVGESGAVLAVEAEPHNARVAQVNRELNDARNLTVLHAAAAECAGVLSFAEGLNGRIDEQAATANVAVRAVTIDDLAREHGTPDIVMIDVEGYEGRVLDGARETVAAGMTSFVVEVHEELRSYGGTPADVLARFASFERFVAVQESEPMRPLRGEPPAGRFFLTAIAPHHAQRSAH